MNSNWIKLGWAGVFLLLVAAVVDTNGFFISHNMTTKEANDTNDFMVVCRDDVQGLAITWHSPKGTVLGPKTRPKVEMGSFGTSIVFTSPIRVEDAGNYTCSSEKEKRMFTLFVEPPLKFTDTATSQTGEEGSDFVLKCEVTRGSISWAVEGGGVIEQNSDKFKVIADGLVIRNVTRHDSKTYICKGVQQSTGTVLDRKIHFNVTHKPVHPNHPYTYRRQAVVYGFIGGIVNLTCLVVANPPATFEWKSNNKAIKIGKTINESAEVSILQLHVNDKNILGNYKCIAKNKLGSYEESFTLKQGRRPPAPSSVEVKEVRSKQVVLQIVEPEKTPEMDLEIVGFSVQFRKVGQKEWKMAEFNMTKSHLYGLEDLEPNTEYELQVASRNAAGLSDYFSPTRWTTSGAASAFSPFHLFASVCATLFLKNVEMALW